MGHADEEFVRTEPAWDSTYIKAELMSAVGEDTLEFTAGEAEDNERFPKSL
jgi:hypothetical protein